MIIQLSTLEMALTVQLNRQPEVKLPLVGSVLNFDYAKSKLLTYDFFLHCS